MAAIWVADTEPNQRFSLYTRGNTGEVFPHVMTALTGTLIGDAVRQGQLDLFLEMGVLRPHELEGPSVGTGVFGGYLYMSGSAMRLFGVRMPGMKATDTDEQVFGTVEGLPPYRPSKGDRNLLASLRISAFALGQLRRADLAALDEARAAARAWLASMPDLADGTDAELLAWVHRTYPPRIGASMNRLLRSSMLAATPRVLLDRVLERVDAPAGLANRIVAGTGDVDSARPAQRMWALGRMVANDATLSASFDAGLDGIAERIDGTPFAAAVGSFLADHGHRGNDEYELATPAWMMDPAPVYAGVDRLRHVPDERSPLTATRRLGADAEQALHEALQVVPGPLRPLVRRAAVLARLGAVARERAKDVLVLENLGARRVLHELARRAAARGGPTDPRLAFAVTIDELSDFVREPSDFAAVIAERTAQQRYLDERTPPLWFEGRIPDPSDWPLRADAVAEPPSAGTTLEGIAVSGGTASGPARVISEPGDPRGLQPGEVLVCAITDPSWTPLFLSAAAVVCDTGAIQSHAAIVARELGIPAVMSVAGITSVADGTVLHVDGDTGEVRIG